MDPDAAKNLRAEILNASDPTTIHNLVKATIQNKLGCNCNHISIPDNMKSMAFKMLKTAIMALEHRLCKEPAIDVFRTRYLCGSYMETLCRTTRRLECLKIQCGLFPCYERWELLNSVDKMGTNILEDIKNFLGKKRSRLGDRVLPILGPNNKSRETVYAVLMVSAAFIRVWWRRKSEGDLSYTNIPSLVQEMEPWFGHINKKDDNINGLTIREWTFTFLSKCTLCLVDERQDYSMAVQFSKLTIKQFGEAASMNVQMIEFSKGICRSICSKMDDQFFQSQFLVCVLEDMAVQCKKHPENLHIFIELAGYCAIQYGEASADECITLASFFHTLAKKYFPEVHFQYVGSIMEHYALGLVVSDSDSYKRWPNPEFSNANSIGNILTQLESHLHEFNQKNLQTYTEFPAFLCDQIATFILSNYEEMIPGDENSRNLPSIGGLLHHFLEPCESATCDTQSTEHMKQVDKLAVTSFMLLLITNQETKGFLGEHMKDGKIQTAVLTSMCQRLRKVYQSLNKCGKVDQAIETLQLCCEASWERVALFCEMVKSSEDEVRNNCFSEDRIVDIVNEAAQDSALLLNIIHQHHTQDVDNTLKTFIDRWVLAQEKFQILSPTALVAEWVRIQCQKNGTAYPAPTIYSLVPSLGNSEQGSCIIIVEELLNYRKMQNIDPQFLEQMENHILDIIGTISSKHINDRFNFLIDCGKRLASRGLKGQFDCIAYITEAVNLLVSVMFFFFFFLTIFLCSHWQRKCDKGDIKVKIGDELRRLLPNAFFLLSLIKRLACPMQKDYTEDIKSGLKLYLENPPSKLNEAECTLLFCILDLLSLEANVELQCEVYEIMIKSSGRNLKEFLGIALQSGNLHHTLCSSPVNAAFLDMVQKHSSLSTDDVKFWRTCVSSESLKAGTYQSLSMLPTLSYLELDDDTRPTKAQETIKEVKLAALSLITSVSESKNEFAAAHHYYNLAEIMIAKGLMTEALTYANEGYRLRNKLLSECFNIEWEGGTEKTSKYLCKTFYMHPSRLSSLGSYCVGTNVYFPTPWNLLRCYLESSLQTGTLHYMIGNSSEASAMLYSGKAISSIQNFPVFLVGFSIALGNMHCKEKDWSSAKRELDSALKSLDDCRRNLCQKCICVLQVKIDQVGGDLDLSIVKNKGENAVNALKIAKDLFVKAKSNLEDKEWENSVSRPERETPKEKNPVLCDFNAACGSNECWHCQTSINETSLSNLTNLKWEIIRRRYLLQVITKLAKCSKLEEDINEERRFLISGIYVLVGRSTFEELELSASFVEEIVRKNVVAEALGAEQASILYKTCCFSLRHENSSGTAILSRNNVLMGLKMAFILSREVPKLHEKVSQILAVVYACSSKDDKLSELERASAIRSASYFHQCSIGSYFNSCFLSQDQNQMEVDGFGDLRLLLAPRSMKELEESMSKFLESLQKLSVTVTVLCISMFSDKSYPILHKFLPERSNSVWLMISRFHLKNGPVVVIFPVIETLTDFPYEKDTSVGQWTCPWAGNLFDQVAPVLRLVLEEDDKLASGQKSSEVVKKRTRHDNFLREFLRNLENSWLGQWKYLLLGECSGCDDLHDNVDIISNDCRSLNSVFEGDQHCWEQLKSNHGCYIGASGGKIDKSVKKNLGDTNEKKCRKPVIIVSHLSTQMIPLESLPILEKEEVYRMPSFGSILRSTSKNRNSLNPCKCYYLIMGDHVDPRTELIKCFKDWSETFQFEGKAGISEEVSAGDLKEALETQDLFIYAGHGDGTQYIPGIEIRKISNCCAAILMGCSSGYLYSRYHAMESATLDYLLAGSPVVVANLWTVYSIDVQSFLKTLFEAWTKATTTKLVECNSNLKKRGSTGMSLCKHGFNLGSAMPKAREACKRRYAEGAASVIYGIPTQIARVIENASQLER